MLVLFGDVAATQCLGTCVHETVCGHVYTCVVVSEMYHVAESRDREDVCESAC